MFNTKPSSGLAAKTLSDESSLVRDEVSDEEADSSSSDVGSGSTSGHSTTHNGESQHSESTQNSLTHNETKAVNRSKIVVYTAILVAATAVGIATYFLMHLAEVDSFHNAFKNYAHQIDEKVNTNALTLLAQVHTLATTYTSFSMGSNASFPMVTLPNFDIRAIEMERFTGIGLLMFTPIVTKSMISAWEAYAWQHQSYLLGDLVLRPVEEQNFDPGTISPHIHPYIEGEYGHVNNANRERELTVLDSEFAVPVWQMGPIPHNATVINLDFYTHPSFKQIILDVLEIDHKLISGVTDLDFLLHNVDPSYQSDGQPRSFIFQPVLNKLSGYMNGTTAGFITAELPWEDFFLGILPDNTKAMVATVNSTCGASFTYEINGLHASFLGMDYAFDSKYGGVEYHFEFAESARYNSTNGSTVNGSHCKYSVTIFSSSAFEASYYTRNPAIFTAVVLLVFFFTAVVFATYDYMVARRQNKLQATAERTNAIVASLFPKDVQERIMAEAEEQAEADLNAKKKGFSNSNKSQLKSFLHEDDAKTMDGQVIFKTKPIADLFPNTTIMFADLVGFTAWSSTREPCQVFTLLETIYHEFDQIAKRRRVFKVETVGDCYVAVAGLPEPRKDHAVVMARFSRDCLYKMHFLLKQLEISLGPDTAELGLRFGLHSGPVTAGVLRGERARFQLFGDTVNTTARIETTGLKNRIHTSSETADLLISAGKAHWVRARDDKVHAKGKGEMSTYWLELRGDSSKSQSSAASSESGGSSHGDNSVEVVTGMEEEPDAGFVAAIAQDSPLVSEKQMRLVDWNTEILGNLLKEVVAGREASGTKPATEESMCLLEQAVMEAETIVLEEVEDIIQLPKFDVKTAHKQIIANDVKLSETVVNQLHHYIQTVAAMYRDNPFHNFEHASHVTMSAVKLLSRIVAPDDLETNNENDIAKELHDHTYGITSDPLTRFAVVIACLLHDVDHVGLPNSQLIKEGSGIAAVYKNKSIAEQNSVDISWDLLQQDSFHDLRRTIYTTAEEFKRFRQLIVNSVMATDIMDKELSQARKARWNIAFAEEGSSDGVQFSKREIVDRKATIVIEHLIQASDVVHTMQHWHIYRKWNARLFEEMYKAYKEGRSDLDPAENWYKGEIGFFDFYIIPLAKKLKDCGVFGVSSDEYLTYALNNRREWEAKGREVVVEMMEKVAGRKL